MGADSVDCSTVDCCGLLEWFLCDHDVKVPGSAPKDFRVHVHSGPKPAPRVAQLGLDGEAEA